jgi:hypothetical protein
MKAWVGLVLAVVGSALVLGGSGCSNQPAEEPAGGSTYAVMQMNLCLSGLAGCYGKVAYPAVVDEAVVRIREAHPDAVTLNEACRGLQHVYGSSELRSPSAEVLPAAHTDHDVLLVRTRLTSRGAQR